MPRIKIVKAPKRLPKAAFGFPVDAMSKLGDMFNKEDQKVAGLQNSGMFNLFDTKWGVQPQGAQQMPEIAPSVYQTQPLVNPANNKGILDTSKLVSSSIPAATTQPQTKQKSSSFNFGKLGDALQTGFGLASIGANYIQNRQQQKEYDKWFRQSIRPENYYAVDTTKDIGDYDQYGKFAANQTGFKSKGMFADTYYPQQGFAQIGGSLVAGDINVRQDYIPDQFIMPRMPTMAIDNTYVAKPPIINKPSNEEPLKGDIREIIAKKESGGDYRAIPKKKDGTLASSAVGKYQFLWNQNKDWITQVTGITNKEDFRNSPEAQEQAFDYWDKNILTPNAKKIKEQLGVNVPMNNLKYIIHFAGPSGAYKYFTTGKETTDVFGTTIAKIAKMKLSEEGGENNNTMKIRIVETPDQEMALGGEPKYSGQSSYGLYVGQRNLYKTMAKHPHEDYGNTVSEKEETPEDPHVLEAEGEETILRPDGTHDIIKGPSHAEDGVKLTASQAPEDSFIFSKTRKMKKITGDMAKFFGKNPDKKHTPAEVAKQYDTNKYIATLSDPTADPLAKKTAKMMLDNYNNKLAHLGLVQEGIKGFPQGIPEISKGLVDKMQGQQGGEEQGEGQQQEMEAKYGGFRKFQGDKGGSTVGVPYANAPAYTGGLNPSDIGGIGSMASQAAARKYALPNWWEHWTKANTPAGSRSPAHGYSSLYDPKAGNPSYDDYEYWRDRYGKDFEGATDVDKRRNFQKYMFGELQKGNPGAYKHIMDYWGQTKAGTLNDAIFGARTAYGAGSRIPEEVPGKTVPGGGGDTTPVPIPGGDTVPQTTPTTPSGTPTPSQKIPYGWSNIDKRNLLNAALDYASLKKYHPYAATIQPELPRPTFTDWTGTAAALSGEAAKQAELLGTFQAGQSQGANRSNIWGQIGDKLAGVIGQTNLSNAQIATAADAQRADILNKFTQYNAAKRDWLHDEENTLDDKYRAAERLARKGVLKAWNQGDADAANVYNTNITESPYGYMDPRTLTWRFNPAGGRAAWEAATRGGGSGTEADSKLALMKKYWDNLQYIPVNQRDSYIKMLMGEDKGVTKTTKKYNMKPDKNSETTKETLDTSKYGGGLLGYKPVNPFLGW